MATKSRPFVMPFVIQLDDGVFKDICCWTFTDTFVNRILPGDIPQRVRYGNATIWAFRDDKREIVGFGVIDVCADHLQITGKPHPHIPLLAVKPSKEGNGYGGEIVKHLIGEAV